MSDHLKERAARAAVALVEDGMVVGLGTGSTAEHAIRALAERVAAQGLTLRCVPTSEASAQLGRSLGLEIGTLEAHPAIDLTIDGADEVDGHLDLVKGLGGALLREKVVAAATARQVIIVDPSKLVDRLGTRAPLPVEVLPFAVALVRQRLADLGTRPELRAGADGSPYVTDNGNHILDCHFGSGIDDAGATEAAIDAIPGVVGNGLFVGLAQTIVVGLEEGGCRVLERQ